MSEPVTIPDLRAEEAELVVTIKKLKKNDEHYNDSNKFNDVLNYYVKLYTLRVKLLGMYHEQIPANAVIDNFKSKEEEYEFFMLQHQYFAKYLQTINNHPIFFQFNPKMPQKTTDEREQMYERLIYDRNNIIKSLNFVEKKLNIKTSLVLVS
jgi:hypothetical protein